MEVKADYIEDIKIEMINKTRLGKDLKRIAIEKITAIKDEERISRFIEEIYRNQGLGETILDDLDDVLSYSLNCEIGCYILLPNPIEKNDEDEIQVINDNDSKKELKNKLTRFYSKCGYRKIPDTEFMYINTD